MKLALFFVFTAHCADGGSGDGLSPSDLVNGLNSFTAADPKEKYRLESLPQQVQDTFAAILDNSVLEKRLYWNTPSVKNSQKKSYGNCKLLCFWLMYVIVPEKNQFT